MKVLARKLRRDFVAAKGMLAAVVAILAFGIASLVGFQSTTNNLTSARDSYYAQCRMADFWVDVKNGQRKALRVVGIGISAEFVYLIPPGGILPEPANFGVFYVPRRFAENSLDMVVRLLTDFSADVAEVMEGES